MQENTSKTLHGKVRMVWYFAFHFLLKKFVEIPQFSHIRHDLFLEEKSPCKKLGFRDGEPSIQHIIEPNKMCT